MVHPDRRPPVLILTRNEVIDRLNEIIVVPATRTIRGLTIELVLTPLDGVPVACATLPESRWPEARRELLCAYGFGDEVR